MTLLAEQLKWPVEPIDVEQQMVAWLKKNPQFFKGKEDLLCSMELDHPCGDAESLLLYQLMRLRDQQARLQASHDHLLGVARENEQRLKHFECLLVRLVETINTAELIGVLSEQLQQKFDIPYLRVWGYYQLDSLLQADDERQKQQLDLLGHRAARCIELDSTTSLLLGLDVLDGGSAALCLLEHEHAAGLMVFAHPDVERFRHKDTLFIEYLGKIISHLLYRDLRNRPTFESLR